MNDMRNDDPNFNVMGNFDHGLTLALSKGRILKETLPLLEVAGINLLEDPEKSRKLIFPTTHKQVRILILRASDVPTYVENVTAFDGDLASIVAENLRAYHMNMEAVDYPRALEAVWNIISRSNKYIDETTPWILIKDASQNELLESVMYHLVENIRFAAVLLRPFLTEAPYKILEQLNLKDNALYGLDS